MNDLKFDEKSKNCNIGWSSSHYRHVGCSIPDPDTDTVLLTGGSIGHTALTTVSRYGEKGLIEDFSSGLNTGRYLHGCGSYISKDNERVKNHVNLKKETSNKRLHVCMCMPRSSSPFK